MESLFELLRDEARVKNTRANLELKTTEKINHAMDYIHNNPVVAGWVSDPEEYLYSSARNYYSKESRLKITSIFDGESI